LRDNRTIVSKIHTSVDEGHQIAIPPVVYYEIRRGLLSLAAPVKAIAFEKLCDISYLGTIDKATMEIAAAAYARLRKTGRVIEDADLLIAAYCIHNGFTLVTNNVKHFEAIEGLLFINWL
jgi:predicted nucleic acid-binding protein